jgi:hypothetical protein
MSGTEARTTDGGTTGTTEIRDDANSAAERLGGPLEDEQSRDTASEAETDVGRRADTTAGEGDGSSDMASEAETDVGRRTDTTAGEGERRSDMASETETDVGRRADTTAGEGDGSSDMASETETDVDRRADATAGEAEQSRDTATEAQTDADRRADTGVGQRTTLIEPERAEGYNSRWNELKSEFVDDPRSAVRGANELVGEVLDELEELFRRQRTDLEHGLDSEQITTEDLRQALGRFRSFFDRLLSF